jgi:phage FluMu gp28-like protein
VARRSADIQIPSQALRPLIELSALLGRLNGSEAEEEFEHLLRLMRRHRGHIASRPWPERWTYDHAVNLDEEDEDFVARGRMKGLDRLTALCLARNMSLAEGFTPSGFLWSFWANSGLAGVGPGEGVNRLRDDESSFSESLLEWSLLPYQADYAKSPSKRIVCCWGRQTGKTKTTAIKVVHFGFVNEGSTVLIVSAGLRQSRHLLEMASGFLESSPVAFNGVESKTRKSIELRNGSRIVALPCSEDRIRGYAADLIICDEAAFMPEDVILRILFPMLGTTGGGIVLLSTPWGRDHIFYRAFHNPEYSVFHVSAEDSPIVSKDLIEEQRRELSEEAFRMEWLAEFAEPSTTFFPQDLIRGCVDPELQLLPSLDTMVPEVLYFGGVDLGKLGDHSVLAVVDTEGKRLELAYLNELPLGTPYTEVIGLVAKAEGMFRFQGLYVDQTGVGEPVLEEMRRCGAPLAKGVTLTAKVKEEAMTALKLAMEQGRLRIPYARRLLSQINEQRYSYGLSGHLVFSHPEGGHDDQLWSLALAVYASTKERRPSAPRAAIIR